MTSVPADSRTSQRYSSAGLTALLLLQVAFFVRFVFGFKYLPGTDAYYYALQAQSLLDVGRLKVPDGGLLHYFIAALSRTGISIEISFRVALIAIFTLYGVGMLLLVLRLRERARLLGILLWILSGSVLAFHTIEFPGLSLGLATVSIWFWLIIDLHGSRWYFLAGLLVVSALIHPALAFVGALWASTVLIARVPETPAFKRWFSIRYVLVGVADSAAVVAILLIRWPGIALRFRSIQLGSPALLAFVRTAGVPLDMKVILILFWGALAFLLFAYPWGCRGPWTYLLPAIVLLPVWPTGEAGLLGLGGRVCGLFVFLALPLLVLVLSEITEKKALAGTLMGRAVWVLSAALIGAIAFLPLRLQGYTDFLMNDDYRQYEQLVSALSHDDIPMLIAQRGLDFFYSYRLKRDAFHFDPEPNWNRAEIWRVAIRITREEIAYYAPQGCIWGEEAKAIEGTDYLLIREDCWEQLRAQLNPNDNPDLYAEVWENAENPSQPRPLFLRERHRGLAERVFPAFINGRE